MYVGSAIAKKSLSSLSLQVHDMQQSVVDTKNRAKESARRFWQTSIPQNAYDDMLSKGQIPSNTAAVWHKPQGKFEPAPAPAYSWRGRTWSDQAGHLHRGKVHSFLLLQSFSHTQDQNLGYSGSKFWILTCHTSLTCRLFGLKQHAVDHGQGCCFALYLLSRVPCIIFRPTGSIGSSAHKVI